VKRFVVSGNERGIYKALICGAFDVHVYIVLNFL
jgi:hypothetical protein